MKRLFLILLIVLLIPVFSFAKTSKQIENQVPSKFIELLIASEKDKKDALDFIKKNWSDSFAVMMVEIIYLNQDPGFTVELLKLLEEKTGKDFGYRFNKWYDWIWNIEEMKHSNYPEFKSQLYSLIDPKFAEYFNNNYRSTIRLDEVRWGGVRQDGIPPLRNPKMISAKSTDYLEDSNIVFGLEINGDARAYPKRIMAWHEMFVDTVGDLQVAGVYCTLCGSMILYKTELNGTNHEIGTSGFLYRSNKLMYDKATQSLWNTLWGRPVIGPLVGKDIELERLSIVTTTWGEWKKRHPDTKVLSLNTGHSRDYGEGVAYKEYFATDELMFNVPKLDKRLKNKDEVLGLIFREHPGMPLAISSKYLLQNPVYHSNVEEKKFVVLTDKSGASRVYESKGNKFKSWDQNKSVKDDKGNVWKLSESKLESSNGDVLYRLPSHNAFWFGWFSAYSNTKLIF